jgi:hypothetical protein
MQHIRLSLAFVLGFTVILQHTSVALADETTTTAGSSISFEEVLDNGTRGKITVLAPTQKTIAIPTPPYKLTDIVPGAYTIFIAPPPGTSTKIQLLENGVEIKSADSPQISFDATVTSHLVLKIVYTLTDFGEVGVTSDPPGVPFTMQGPGNAEYEGITPQTFSRVPIGSYGVLYKPKGCSEPPGQGEDLKRGSKVYFTITLHCETFEAVRNPAMGKADSAVFHDVDKSAWYAPFVTQAAKTGIMSGYKDENGNTLGLFGPGNEITLAELAKISHVLAGIDEQEFSGRPSNIMAQDAWYKQVFLSAEKRDWRLYTDPQTDPNRAVTRGEVLVTFMQALDVPLKWAKGDVFKDVSRRTPYASAIETAAGLGYVQGKTNPDGSLNGMFGPENHINRAEMAKLLTLMTDRLSGVSQSSAPAARGR